MNRRPSFVANDPFQVSYGSYGAALQILMTFLQPDPTPEDLDWLIPIDLLHSTSLHLADIITPVLRLLLVDRMERAIF